MPDYGALLLWSAWVVYQPAAKHSDQTRRGFFEVEVELSSGEDTPFHVVLVSQEIDHVTPENTRLVAKLPKWISPCPWVSHWRKYVF